MVSNERDKPTLYIMLGWPGAGKTTSSKVICELTGAVHVWADKVRREMFKTPKFTQVENDLLYNRLNEEAVNHLNAGESVVFDTSFNHREDREQMRRLAKEANANYILIWVKSPESTARIRATQDAHIQPARPQGDMSDQDFDRLISKLEIPTDNEEFIELDGTKITDKYVAKMLML